MHMKYSEYKKHWLKRDAENARKLEQERQRAIRFAVKLKDILVRDYKVSKVVLFGSCIYPQGFNERSDIDLAVENLAKERYFEALATLCEASPRSVDLKPIEEVKNHLKEKIQRGMILYDAGKNS